jgi:predicted ester cyclase
MGLSNFVEGIMKKYLWIIPLILLFCFMVACRDKAAMAELEKSRAQAAVEAKNIELIKTLFAQLDKGNTEIFRKLCAPDFKFVFPSNNSAPLSREDEMVIAKALRTAIPDMEHQISDIFAVKDRVVVIHTLKGTHMAELGGIPPTGNSVVVSAISVYRMKDGLVAEEIEDANMLGFYQHLGMQLKSIEIKK